MEYLLTPNPSLSNKLNMSQEDVKKYLTFCIQQSEMKVHYEEFANNDYYVAAHKNLHFYNKERNLLFVRNELNKLMSILKEKEKKVIVLRFGLLDGRSRTLEEVGNIFGVTRERIRQIEAKALRKLKGSSPGYRELLYVDLSKEHTCLLTTFYKNEN